MTRSSGGSDALPRSARFRPEQRIRASEDFAALFKSGQRYSDPRFVIYYRPGSSSRARLGLAVSKRVARKATQRNRLKRRLRETFRNLGDALPSLDFVILLRPDAATATSDALHHSLIRAFDVIRRAPARQRDRQRQ